jgi:thiol-disulfide isomerase/thioredoxin
VNHSFLSPADATPAALLAESLVSFSFRRLARRAARYIARFFLLPILCPLFRQLNCSFLFVADFLSVAPVAVSVVLLSMSGARLIALLFHASTWCPACRSLVLIPILTILLRRDFVCATHG